MRTSLLFSLLVTAALSLSADPSPKRDVFSIPLPKRNVLRFIVVGDAGTGDPHLHNGILRIARQTHIDAILLVGDNVYPCGVTSVNDPQWSKVTINFADSNLPIYPILGNHDYGDPTPVAGKTVICGNPSPAAQVLESRTMPQWIFPARNYALRSRMADIIMIDSQPIASEFDQPFLGSETLKSELDWAASALETSGKGWRIVVGHHTIFSSGIHGITNHRDQRHLRADLLPLLQKEHVDLYICGHDHDAELIGSLRHRKDMPLFLIAGDGAHSEEMQKRNRPDEPPTIFPKSFPPAPLVGFTLLEITNKTIAITFYDGVGNRRSDTYTMRK